MTDLFADLPPHSWVCRNASCPEVDVVKDALTALSGPVLCGACQQACDDLGPIVGRKRAWE